MKNTHPTSDNILNVQNGDIILSLSTCEMYSVFHVRDWHGCVLFTIVFIVTSRMQGEALLEFVLNHHGRMEIDHGLAPAAVVVPANTHSVGPVSPLLHGGMANKSYWKLNSVQSLFPRSIVLLEPERACFNIFTAILCALTKQWIPSVYYRNHIVSNTCTSDSCVTINIVLYFHGYI